MEVKERYESMESAEQEFMERAEESMRFTTGGYGKGQWDEEDYNKLSDEDRSPLQLDIILPKVAMISGVEIQNRTYWKTSPVGDEDRPYTQLITPALLYVERQQHLNRKFSRGFKYAGITGRDWLDIFVREDDEFGKELVVRRESWANVLLDPDARTDDPSEWNCLARKRWLTVSEVNARYNLGAKKPEDIPRGVEYGDPTDVQNRENGSYYDNEEDKNMSYLDKSRKRVKVIDYWDREWRKEYVVVGNGVVGRAKTKSDAREILNLHAEAAGIDKIEMNIVSRATSDIYHTQFSGDRILKERAVDKYNHKQFQLVPIFYYFEDMGDKIETFGIVENLKDPQREKNKRRSQALDILSRSPKGGGIIDQRAGITSEELNHASANGLWAKVTLKAGKKLSDIMQQWSMGHIQILNYISNLEERAEYDAKEISGATDPLMGVASASKESGLAANTRIRQGLTTLEEPLQNLDFAKKRVLKMIISNMQQYWSEDKFARVIGAESDAEQQDIELFVDNFKKNNVLKYDITLTKTDSPTVRSIRYKEIGDLIQKIPQYAPALLPEFVNASDWESREEILQKIEEIRMQEMMKGQASG